MVLSICVVYQKDGRKFNKYVQSVSAYEKLKEVLKDKGYEIIKSYIATLQYLSCSHNTEIQTSEYYENLGDEA